MIKNSTVFVLGAGAHCSYGFPSGPGLKRHIAQALQSPGEHDDFAQLSFAGMAEIGAVGRSTCEALSVALSNSGQPSIDAFLDTNQRTKGYDVLGKAAIAQVLMRFESSLSEPVVSPNDDDWLNYVFEKMVYGARSLEQFINNNSVSFVTFNYDRLLERWLHTKIQHSFGLSTEEALDALSRIPICHVYGMVGDYPYTLRSRERHPWVNASRKIRLIHEVKSGDEALERAKRLLERAHVIVMLGFGFHPENIEVLDLVRIVRANKGIVAASRYNITDAEWLAVDKVFRLGPHSKSIEQAPRREDMCLATLRAIHPF